MNLTPEKIIAAVADHVNRTGHYVTVTFTPTLHRADGVYVDASSSGLGSRYFVSWEGGRRGKGPGPGPLVLVEKSPK